MAEILIRKIGDQRGGDYHLLMHDRAAVDRAHAVYLDHQIGLVDVQGLRLMGGRNAARDGGDMRHRVCISPERLLRRK